MNWSASIKSTKRKEQKVVRSGACDLLTASRKDGKIMRPATASLDVENRQIKHRNATLVAF